MFLLVYDVKKSYEGRGVSDLSSVPYDDTGSSIMPLCAAWALGPGGKYWEPS